MSSVLKATDRLADINAEVGTEGRVSQPRQIDDVASVASALLPPRTTLYQRTDIPREQLFLDTPGTPHTDHVLVTPELGARIIAGLEGLGEQPPNVQPETLRKQRLPSHRERIDERHRVNIADPAYSDDESAQRRFELVAKIEATAEIIDPAILEAMRAVPREVFAPSFFLRDGAGHRLLRREIDETNWLAEAYQDQALTTQLDCGLHADAVDAARDGWHGVPTCSASEPSVVARMLDELAIQPGARVLEIGAGTGYNAALLCELAGSENVFSIEYDPVLAAKAKDHLAVTGYYPTVSVGDGARGYPNAAPFDAIIATCSFPAIYPAWLEQLAPGGVAVVNLITGIRIGVLAALTLSAPGDVSGRIVPQRAWVMSTRSHLANRALALSEAAIAGEVRTHATWLRWSEVAGSDGLHVLAALMLDAHLLVSFTEDGAEQYGLYASDGSVALEQEGRVEQSGPRQLWDELERIALRWTALGQPERDELELSIAFKVGKAHTAVVHPASGWSASATGVQPSSSDCGSMLR